MILPVRPVVRPYLLKQCSEQCCATGDCYGEEAAHLLIEMFPVLVRLVRMM